MKVKVLIPFFDKKENKLRELDEVFTVDHARFEEIRLAQLRTFSNDWIEIVEDTKEVENIKETKTTTKKKGKGK